MILAECGVVTDKVLFDSADSYTEVWESTCIKVITGNRWFPLLPFPSDELPSFRLGDSLIAIAIFEMELKFCLLLS